MVDLGDVEEGTPADAKRQSKYAELFDDIVALHKKLQQLKRSWKRSPLSNKKSAEAGRAS